MRGLPDAQTRTNTRRHKRLQWQNERPSRQTKRDKHEKIQKTEWEASQTHKQGRTREDTKDSQWQNERPPRRTDKDEHEMTQKTERGASLLGAQKKRQTREGTKVTKDRTSLPDAQKKKKTNTRRHQRQNDRSSRRTEKRQTREDTKDTKHRTSLPDAHEKI